MPRRRQTHPDPPMPAPMPAPIATTERGKSGSKASQSAAITDSPQFMWFGPGVLLARAAASTASMLTLSRISSPHIGYPAHSRGRVSIGQAANPRAQS